MIPRVTAQPFHFACRHNRRHFIGRTGFRSATTCNRTGRHAPGCGTASVTARIAVDRPPCRQ